MTRSEQDAEERRALDFMIEKQGLATVDVTARKPPAADFTVTLRDGTILAIEHTDARDERVAPVTAVVERWKQAVKEHLATLRISAWLHATFREDAAAALNKQPKVLRRQAELLATLAAEDAPHLVPDAIIEHDAHDLEVRGIEYAFYAVVQRYPEPFATWGTCGRGQRSSLIQAAIDAKAAKLPAYRAAAPEGAKIWLLVVAGSGGHGTSIDAVEAEGTFRSPFEKSIFVDVYEGKCIELDTGVAPTDVGRRS